MNLTQIENIVKIAEEKSITRAAEKLFLTQSALNQQLLKLEKELGTELFKRTKSDWSPTKAGEIYLEGAREILRTKQRTYSLISDLSDTLKGHITVGLTPGRGPDMFTHVYPIFHKNYPNMIVEPRELSVAKQQPMISSGDLDIGFMSISAPSQQTKDEYLTLYEEELFLALPKSFPLPKGCIIPNKDSYPTLSLELLKDQPFVLMYKESTMRLLIDKIFREYKFFPKVLFDTANNSTVQEMVRAKLCCGIVPEYAAKHYSKGGIAYYSIPSHPKCTIVVSYRRGARLSNASKLFIQYAKDYWMNM